MQPKQIHELLDNFYKRPIEAVELVKKMLVSNDESTFSVWVENEKSNKFDSACDVAWPSNNFDNCHPNFPHLTIFCNTCGIINSSSLCLSCFMRTNSNKSHSEINSNINEQIKNKNNNAFEDLDFEPHPNHDVYFKYTPIGHCTCGDINSMNRDFFCSYHSFQPTNPPNIEIFGSDHCDFITDLTDICFRSLILHGSHSTENVESIVNFLLDLAGINSSYLHLIAAALSENFDSSALFTHWPQFLPQNAVSIVKLIETLSIDDSFQFAFATSFYDNYIYLLSYDLNIIEPFNPSPLPTSVIPLLSAANIAWTYFINHEEMIEDFSIAELIGKEFYILTSFIRNDPFHPIISHSLIRNFFNTMNTFFSSKKFFKTLTSPESISKITDIYIDALTLESFPIVTKKYNFYDFDKFIQNFKYIYDYDDDGFPLESVANRQYKGNDFITSKSNETLFPKTDDLYSYFDYEEKFEYDDDCANESNKYSLDKHVILRNFVEKIDPKYQFIRCSLKFKKNLFCAIEHLSDMFKKPESFILPLLCGMIKTFFSTMSPDQFTFQNDFLSTISGPSINKNNSDNNNNNNLNTNSDLKKKEAIPSHVLSFQKFNNDKKDLNQKPSSKNVNNNDDDSVIVENLLKLQLNSHKKHFVKPKNTLEKIHFTHYYESKEPFYFRSVLDDLPLLSCSAPCHSIAFRKLCKYSTNGIEDWRKAIKGANVYEIMFSNSSFLRSTFMSKSNKDIENEIDQGIKLYLEDIALLTVTIIPMRICALSSLISLGVMKINNKLLKKKILKSKNSNRKDISYDNFFRSLFQKDVKIDNDEIDILGNSSISKETNKNNKNDEDIYRDKGKSNKKDYKDNENLNNNNLNDYDDIEEDDYEEDYGDLDDFNDEYDANDDDEDCDSNDFYYNLFLKYADFSYDILGSFAGSICALSFASNIGYLSIVTYCIFDLKNGITSRKLFAYLNFLICCVSDRAVYAKDDEKLCWFFIRNLLSKRGKMSGKEILNECDAFFTKKKIPSNQSNYDYYILDSNGVDDLLLEENDFEDQFIENKMFGKRVDELDSFELLSGRSHSFSKKLTDRFSRPIINKILAELAEPVNRFETSLQNSNLSQIVFKLRDEFNEFKPSIFNTAQESFDQWSLLLQRYPKDAFLKISFDNEYKPSGFSPQSVLLTSEFNSILFITALEAVNSNNFDKETIHIFFAILNYINQLNFYFDISSTKEQTEIKNITAQNLNDLINNVPSTFSQFLKTPIKFKDYPETTFNDLLLRFGEIGEFFINQSIIKSSKSESSSSKDQINKKKANILNLFEKKRLDYLNSIVQSFEINRFLNINKSDTSTNFLITIPILIFDGFSGRQIWASSSSCNQLHQAIKQNKKTEKNQIFVYNCTSDSRKNAWIPANLNPSFQSLRFFIDNDIELEKESHKESLVDSFINQFGFFNPEKNLFNIIQSTIENIELRLRSFPFILDDIRPKLLLGNAFRVLWSFVQKKLKNKRKDQINSEKVEIIIDRAFNYRNNELWSGFSMNDKTVLRPLTTKLTFLLSLLLTSENPIEKFSDFLSTAFELTKKGGTGDAFSIECNGFNFVIQNFKDEINLKPILVEGELFERKIKVNDKFDNLVFLRCSFIVAFCCLWIQIEQPSSLFDPKSETAISELYELLLKKKPQKETNKKDNLKSRVDEKFTGGLDTFSFVDLPNNFFGFSEFPFAAEILNNNIFSVTSENETQNTNSSSNNDESSSSSSSFSLENEDKNNEDDGVDVVDEKLLVSVDDDDRSCILFNDSMFLSCRKMEMVKRGILDNFKVKMKKRNVKFFGCYEAVDLLNGKVGDYETLVAKSDSNCSVMISLSGKDAGLCYAYNKSLNIESQAVMPVYMTLFGDTGIKSGEFLYLNRDRVLKLQDSFLSGELFL